MKRSVIDILDLSARELEEAVFAGSGCYSAGCSGVQACVRM